MVSNNQPALEIQNLGLMESNAPVKHAGNV